MSSDPLLQPFTIKRLRLRNRLVSTSHEPAYAEDAKAGLRYQLYHEEKAKGGIALTMIGGAARVAVDAAAAVGHLDISDDSIVPSFQQLADRVHRHGTAVTCQITHAGRRARWDGKYWLPVVSPSPIREPANRSFPKIIEEFDVRRIVKAYGAAARRCEMGGLDGIELMCHSGHLIDQYWSPRLNHRTDRYGGSLQNRMRFGLAVLDEVRDQVGEDFIVGVRMYTTEDVEGGLTEKESLEIAEAFVETGGIDFLSLVKGTNTRDSEYERVMPSMGTPQGPYLTDVARFRRTLGDIPIIHATRITDLATAREAVREGHVDLVGMVRAHMADPHIVKKIQDGEEHRIRPCVGASYCIHGNYTGKGAQCIHNPATGREGTIPHIVPRASEAKKAVVVGAGPAGLEAARVLAERGHEVVQFEAADQPGGQVRLAANATGRHHELILIIDWLTAEVKRLGVDLRLNARADDSAVKAEKPNVIIIATGGSPNLHPEQFTEGHELVVSTWDILDGTAALENRILIYDDHGGEQALSAAERILESGAELEIVSPDRLVGHDVPSVMYPAYLRAFYAGGATLTPDHRLRSVRRDAGGLIVTLRNEYTKEDAERAVDQVVVEHGTLPRDELYTELVSDSTNRGETDLDALIQGAPQKISTNSGGIFQLFRVGDAVAHRNIHAAMLDARRLCMTT